MPAKPPVVRVLGIVLVLEAAVFGCLGVLAAIVAAVLALTPATGGNFRDLAGYVIGALAVLALLGAGIGLLAWVGLRARRSGLYLAGCALHVLPMLGMLLLGYGRTTVLMAIGVWFFVVGLVGLLSEPRRWVAAGPSEVRPAAPPA